MKSLDNQVDREEILRRLASLTPDSRALWGKMNVHQMLCHLNDSYLLCMGERESEPVKPTFLNRTLVRWVALQAPMKWPNDTPTRPEAKQGVGGTPPTDFAEDRQALIASVQRFAVPESWPVQKPHPIFGPLSNSEWKRWGYLHPDHHLRQFGA